MNNSLNRLSIAPGTNQWSSNLDTALPIYGSDIPGFVSWVNGGGFTLDRSTGKGHDGFDFGAYLRDDRTVVIGLPKETPVRAVADGIVKQVLMNDSTGWEYGCLINVEHGGDTGMFSGYCHVDPSIEANTEVHKGDILGTLYKDKGSIEGRLVHLHLQLADGWGTHGTSIMGGGLRLRLQDPGLIDSAIYDLTPETQGWKPFDAIESLGAHALHIAHFERVRVGGSTWHRSP